MKYTRRLLNCDQYVEPSPDFTNRVFTPYVLAVWAMVVGLPPDERLTYQIHIPRPSNGPATADGTGRHPTTTAATQRRIRTEKRTVDSG
jgi:hypothetical protein